MKLIVVTYGTEGDTRPAATLCRALLDAGHAVRLLADASTLPYASALGIPVRPLAGDIRAALRGSQLTDSATVLADLAKQHTAEWMDAVLEEARGCDAVVVGGLAAFVGLSAADALGIKVIGAMLIPITPTTAFTAPFLPFALPAWLNSASHRLINALVWSMLRGATNAARALHGLPPRGGVWSGHPMLYGVSPSLLPQPADYPPNAVHTGQWVPPRGAWEPPAELAAFLAAGEKPVYVGFGSMAGFSPSLPEAIVGALGSRRAIFNKGWSTVDTAAMPPNIHLIDPAPHDWLLPRCAMAVHHGGSGTTHSACAAGIPSIILPMAGDQSFWARRMKELGIADDVLDGHKVTKDQLFAVIVYADGTRAQETARKLGEDMGKEDGTQVAVDLIEQMVGL